MGTAFTQALAHDDLGKAPVLRLSCWFMSRDSTPGCLQRSSSDLEFVIGQPLQALLIRDITPADSHSSTCPCCLDQCFLATCLLVFATMLLCIGCVTCMAAIWGLKQACGNRALPVHAKDYKRSSEFMHGCITECLQHAALPRSWLLVLTDSEACTCLCGILGSPCAAGMSAMQPA